ncbi:MAG: hypothetical protein EZS28_044249, partial [Streblomastix strix]
PVIEQKKIVVVEAPKPLNLPNASEVEVDNIAYIPLLPHPDSASVDGDIITNSKENEINTSILFDPVINSGIVNIEVLNVKGLQALGIADESIRFSENEKPNEKEVGKVLSYNLNGEIIHIGDNISGNKDFKAGDRIALEV